MAVALGLLAQNLIKVGPQGAPHLPRWLQTGPCTHRAGVGKRGFWGAASVEGTQDTHPPLPLPQLTGHVRGYFLFLP